MREGGVAAVVVVVVVVAAVAAAVAVAVVVAVAVAVVAAVAGAVDCGRRAVPTAGEGRRSRTSTSADDAASPKEVSKEGGREG